VIAARGFGDRFIHRTGHSIDPRSLHGQGPHLDNLETREERTLVPGIGFSIEPGVYLPGELGMRSEVNAFLQPGGGHYHSEGLSERADRRLISRGASTIATRYEAA
jgi:Xaa-Pro aminopeptidase